MKLYLYLTAAMFLTFHSGAIASAEQILQQAQANAQNELQRKITEADMPAQNKKLLEILDRYDSTLSFTVGDGSKEEKFSKAYESAKKGACAEAFKENSIVKHKKCNTLLRLANELLPTTPSVKVMTSPAGSAVNSPSVSRSNTPSNIASSSKRVSILGLGKRK